MSCILCQNTFDMRHQTSNNPTMPSYTPQATVDYPSYTPQTQSATADYPFTMQQYPATNYPSTMHDYSIASQDDVMANSWTADDLEPSRVSTSPPAHPPHQQQQQQQPPVPDAVINVAAKVGSDKKPFAYIADVNDIRQQRDRVRRKYASYVVCSLTE